MYLGRVGVPKTSRDTKKDCEKPGCPSDHPGQGARPWRRGDRMSATSANGTFRTWRDVRLESVNCSKADVVFAGSCSPGISKKLGDLKRAFGRPNPSGRANHSRSGASLSVPFLEPFPRSIKLTRPR